VYLKALSLKNFRNIPEASLSFHEKFNVFVGANAQGKTNILESIHLLSIGRSFRLADYKGLISWEKTEAFVRAWLELPIGEEERTIQLTVEKKKTFKNGKGVSPNQFQFMPIVLFAPEEILLLKDSPQARRDYVDGLLIKLSAIYEEHLRDYKRALTQRNKLLKDELIPKEEKKKQMTLWESPMVEHGSVLIKEREAWMNKLNGILNEYYKIIGHDAKSAQFAYSNNVNLEEFSTVQEAKREEELERKASLVGPHRDDFKAQLDTHPINAYGSQGEMRTFTLALKLSEIKLFEEVLNQSPLLLLDDVVSELDEKRSAYFFSYLQSYTAQVFATATALSLFPKDCLKEFRAWEIRQGKPFTF